MRNAQWLSMIDELPFRLLPAQVLKDFGVEGVEGFSSGQPFPESNLVGRARLHPAVVDDTIDRVLKRFEGRPFTWVVGPETKPPDLPARLHTRGFSAGPVLDGMVFFPPVPKTRVHSRWLVKKATWAEVLEHASILAPAYGHGMSAEAFRHVLKSLAQSATDDGEIYLAFAPDLPTPIGYGVMLPLGDRAVFLSGSATLPEWRHQGVYRSLVLQRMQDAFQAGAEAALITAVTTTSAPICQRLGFQTCCQIQQWCGNPLAEPSIPD